jgi:hypothetical protein
VGVSLNKKIIFSLKQRNFEIKTCQLIETKTFSFSKVIIGRIFWWMGQGGVVKGGL